MLVLTVPRFGTYLTLAAAAFGRARPMWGQRARCTSSAAVFASVALAEAMDAAKCNAEFLVHGVKRAFERGAPSNQHVVVACGQSRRWSKPDQLAQAAPHPVALHGIANLFTHGETNPRRASLGSRAGLQDKGVGMNSHTMSSRTGPGSLGDGPKVTPAFQPLHCSDFDMTAFQRTVLTTQPKHRARCAQALSLLRPRARRAAKTLRPPLLAIRVRKPWRRFRTSLLG